MDALVDGHGLDAAGGVEPGHDDGEVGRGMKVRRRRRVGKKKQRHTRSAPRLQPSELGHDEEEEMDGVGAVQRSTAQCNAATHDAPVWHYGE